MPRPSLHAAAVGLAAIAIALAPSTAAAARAPRGGERVTVEYVTASRAYLDHGADDGLAVGQKLSFVRNGRSAGACTIDHVSPASASCAGAALRPGDTAPIASVERARPKEVPSLPPVPNESALASQRARVLEAPYPRVDAKTSGRVLGSTTGLRAEAALSHHTWVNVGRTWNQERVDLALRGTPVVAGARFYLDASAVRWTTTPVAFRSPHRDPTQLFVYEAALAQREPRSSLVWSAGRLWPWRAANVGVVDGAQVGWRSEGGGIEVGAFGGVRPQALNLAPDLSRPIAGAYAALSSINPDGAVRWSQQEAHVSVAPGPDASRVQAELLARAGFGQWADGSIDVRLALGGEGTRLLDAASAHFSARAGDRFDLFAAARYEATPLEVLPAAGALPFGHRSLRGDAAASLKTAQWLALAVSGGYANDLESQVSRAWAGPELRMPRLAGGHLGLFFGYQEELGWVRGRTAWAQAQIRAADRLDIFARGAWTQSGPGTDPLAPWNPELGSYLSLRYRITPAIAVRLAAWGRWVLASEGEESGSTPFGWSGTGSVAANF